MLSSTTIFILHHIPAPIHVLSSTTIFILHHIPAPYPAVIQHHHLHITSHTSPYPAPPSSYYITYQPHIQLLSSTLIFILHHIPAPIHVLSSTTIFILHHIPAPYPAPPSSYYITYQPHIQLLSSTPIFILHHIPAPIHVLSSTPIFILHHIPAPIHVLSSTPIFILHHIPAPIHVLLHTHQLVRLNISPKLVIWIINFLSHRKQFVRFKGVLSGEWSISTGVPQGCVLSPVLFTLYTNIYIIYKWLHRNWKHYLYKILWRHSDCRFVKLHPTLYRRSWKIYDMVQSKLFRPQRGKNKGITYWL